MSLPGRQPVHTVYGGAHLFKASTAQTLGSLAIRSLEEFGSEPREFAEALGIPAAIAQTVHERVRRKLEREPVEDFRIDFEDGYGNRPDAEEDQHALQAAAEVAKGMTENSLPPFIGIRIKPFSSELRERSIRTLELFVSTLCAATRGRLPENFVVTLPEVVIPEQPAAMVKLLEALEAALDLEEGSLRFELMIETTQAIFNARGESNLPHLL